MRQCYKANLAQTPQEYPLFFLDPRLRGSPGGVYYRQQFGALIELYGARRVANNLCARVLPISLGGLHEHGRRPVAIVLDT